MGTKKVSGQGYVCDYCGELLDTIETRSEMHFCNAGHAILWREQNGVYAAMSKLGKAGRDADIEKRKQSSFYADMSQAGKAGRQRAMPQSNKDKPRRKRRAAAE